eukprot:CAMPEP_0168280854 /NCGR_PEP_ID=MMETSP0141_2-20121125/21381_1 /TAXON_ID=44445 /ORGANISM="Pseudo-nitzschia australis, Strain 10249 10 AB" /LENGTH=305 /DNA_ID=CAMNT_0008224191 /DNA_START=29 /DNA_END=946 /DNA_ORIENTATION=-
MLFPYALIPLFLVTAGRSTAFVANTGVRSGFSILSSSSSSSSNDEKPTIILEDEKSSFGSNPLKKRRQVFSDVLSRSVSAAPFMDAAFAQGMAVGMVDYEREAYPKKKELFKQLFSSLPINGNKNEEPVVVEIGIGSFPNALYYKGAAKGLDIVGIDPNDWMAGYAKENAERAGLLNVDGDNLRIVHGISEALPLLDGSCDAVVCTLTLCSVVDPVKSVSEIKRVLKPGGKFLFWEHVLSQTDPNFARQQILNTPNQVKRADGCHLDRRTGEIIQQVGFSEIDLQYIELKKFGFLNPTVCGIATA